MDDGSISSAGLKIATNNFDYSDLVLVAKILNNKYNLKVSIQKSGVENQYVLYFHKKSMNALAILVKPHLHPSMYYKLNGYV